MRIIGDDGEAQELDPGLPDDVRNKAILAVNSAMRRSFVGKAYDWVIRGFLKATYSLRTALAFYLCTSLGFGVDATYRRLGV